MTICCTDMSLHTSLILLERLNASAPLSNWIVRVPIPTSFCTYVVWLRLCSWNQDTGTQKTQKTERKAIKDFDLAWAWTRVWFRFDVVPFLNKDFTYVFIIFSWASANVCACVRVYVEVHKASNWFHRLLFLWTLNPFPMLVNNMEKYRDIFFAWIHFVLCLESGFYHFEIFQESQVNLFR